MSEKTIILSEVVNEASDFDFFQLDDGTEFVTLDFDGLKFIDSSGLGNWIRSLQGTNI